MKLCNWSPDDRQSANNRFGWLTGDADARRKALYEELFGELGVEVPNEEQLYGLAVRSEFGDYTEAVGGLEEDRHIYRLLAEMRREAPGEQAWMEVLGELQRTVGLPFGDD